MGAVLALPFAYVATNVFGASAATASLVGSVGSLVLGTGLAVAAQALMPKPETPEPSSGSVETQQPIPPRTFVYGRLEISGPLGLKKVAIGEESPSLLKTIYIMDGKADAIETIWGDDQICLLDVDGYVVSGPFIQAGTPRVQIFLHYGDDDQVADAHLLTKLPTILTADHRLRGITYAAIDCHGTGSDNFFEAYPHQEPNFKFTVRGRRVWDPRVAEQDPDDPETWMWTDNSGLCILDWACMHPKGYARTGITRDMMDLSSFEDFASLCDEYVDLNSGNVERRYRVATQIDLKNQPLKDAMAVLRASCDARLYQRNGVWGIRGGQYTPPTVGFSTDRGHIIEAEMSDGVDALSRYNETTVKYLSPDNHYAETECDKWLAVDDEEYAVGMVRTNELSWSQVPSFAQARRLTKIRRAYDNPDWIGSLKTNFYGLDAIGEENIQLQWSEDVEDSDVDGPYWVEAEMTMLMGGAGAQIPVRSCNAAAFDWDAATEEGEPPAILPPDDLNFDVGVPPDNPGDFAVEFGVREIIATWTSPSPADDSFYLARVWRAPSGGAFADAEDISGPRYRERHEEPTVMMFQYPADPEVEWCYYLTVENPVGDKNTPVGPICGSSFPPT